MQSDTPRTDAENWIRDMGFEKWVSIDFARELERELAAAKAELVRNADELAAAIKQRDEARDTAAAIHKRNWYEAKTEYGTELGKVRAELAAAKAELSKKFEELAAAWMVKDDLLAELAKVRQQRDEARRDACAFEAINRWNEAHPKGIMSPCAVARIAGDIAVERGWYCFAQQEGGGA